MDQILVIIVVDYPFGTGEPFLEAELKVIYPYFKRIIIVSTQPLQKSEPLFFVPHNATLVNLPIQIKNKHKLFSIFSQNYKHIWQEVKAIRNNYKLSFDLNHFKTLFASGIRARILYKKLSFILFKEQELKENCILYSYWCEDSAYALALLEKKTPSLNTLTRMHGWDIYFERHPHLYLPYRQIIFKLLDIFAPISANGKKYLTDKFPFIDERRIVVSKLGSPPMRSSVYSTPLSDVITILSLSNILELKRIDRIIKALSNVNKKKVIWYHIGGGELQPIMEKLAKSEFSGTAVIQYFFLGNLGKKEIMDFFEQHTIDCLINASDTEGIPVSMMEALSAGVPLIGPDVGGVSEIIEDGVNGFLVKSDATDAYTAAIDKLINLSLEDYLSMRKNAYSSWQQKFNSEINFVRFAESIKTAFNIPYKQCTRCILDNNDYPEISFDDQGVCNMCYNYDELARKSIFHGEEGKQKIEQLLAEIKQSSSGKKYDCLVGVSGGVDSFFLAYLCKQWGLNPLIVHIDNGWNTELAVDNIDSILNKLGFELHTEVLNWPIMRDLQLAFIKANVVDIDLPMDNAFIAALNRVASQHAIKHILTGHNTATEGNLPPNFNHFKLDLINLKDIHKKFGNVKLNDFPLIGPLKKVWYEKFKGIKFYYPLNWLEYNKLEVKKLLTQQYGWRDYGGKHYENIFTRFYQGYILPEKFGIDKRKAHLSHLICSGQKSREEAIFEFEHTQLYESEELLQSDIEYFIKKFKITEQEFKSYINSPPISHRAFRSMLDYYELFRPFKVSFKKAAQYFKFLNCLTF